MKKVKVALSTFLALAICAVAIACFAACSPAGTYKFYSMSITVGSTTTEYKVGDEFTVPMSTEKVKLDKDYYVIELKKDGTFTMTTKGSGTQSTTGTWEENDGKIDFKANEVSILSATKDGNKLIIESGMEGMKSTVTLKK